MIGRLMRTAECLVHVGCMYAVFRSGCKVNVCAAMRAIFSAAFAFSIPRFILEARSGRKLACLSRCMVAENSYSGSAHFPPTEFRNVRRDGAKAASQELNAACARDLRSRILDPLSPLCLRRTHALSQQRAKPLPRPLRAAVVIRCSLRSNPETDYKR